MIVFGKEDDRYLISDPVMETATSLTDMNWKGFVLQKVLLPHGDKYIIRRKKEL